MVADDRDITEELRYLQDSLEHDNVIGRYDSERLESAAAEIRRLRSRVAELEGRLGRPRSPQPSPACDHCGAAPAVMSRPHPSLGGEASAWCHRCYQWADRVGTREADGGPDGEEG